MRLIDDFFEEDNIESIVMPGIKQSVVNDIGKCCISHLNNIYPDICNYMYEMIDKYIMCIYDDHFTQNSIDTVNEVTLFDGRHIPINNKHIAMLLCFNDSFDIDFILVLTVSLYEDNNVMGDDDYYVILLSNIIYEKFSTVTYKIIYNIKNKRKNFNICTTDKFNFTESFCTQFPICLNIEGKTISNIIKLLDVYFDNIPAFINCCKSLYKQKYKTVMMETSKCYVNDGTLCNPGKLSLQFVDTVLKCSLIEDIYVYYIIDKKCLLLLSKLTENMLLSNIINGISFAIKKVLI